MARPGRPPDDLGYLPQARESEVLFTLIAERYERRSLGITSNLVYSEWERLRQPHGHRRSHRPGGPPHHYPRVRRPQLPHRCGPAAGSGTEGESQSPVNRHPPTPYSSGGPRSIQDRGPRSALRRDSSARRRAPSLIASSQGESFEALNAHLERRCLARMDARLRGHSESIGQRMKRDLPFISYISFTSPTFNNLYTAPPRSLRR